MGLLIGRTSLSHGLSLGCSFVLSSMSCAVLQRLPRLSGLLCRKHRTFLGEIQSLFTLQHVILVPYKKQTFVSVIPAAVACIVPLPRCSVLAAANSAVPASFSLLPVASWVPPPIQQLVQVLLMRYNPGTGCMISFQPHIRKMARLHSFPYGSRVSGTPPPLSLVSIS